MADNIFESLFPQQQQSQPENLGLLETSQQTYSPQAQNNWDIFKPIQDLGNSISHAFGDFHLFDGDQHVASTGMQGPTADDNTVITGIGGMNGGDSTAITGIGGMNGTWDGGMAAPDPAKQDIWHVLDNMVHAFTGNNNE